MHKEGSGSHLRSSAAPINAGVSSHSTGRIGQDREAYDLPLVTWVTS